MQAFDRPFLDRLYRYCYALTADQSAAYDLLQDGVERFLGAADRSSRSSAHTEAFIKRIIRNRFIDLYRSSARNPTEAFDDNGPVTMDMDFDGLEKLVLDGIEIEQLWAQMEPLDREIVYLWAVEGQTAKEVADSMQLPRGTILSRIHRLRRRLLSEAGGSRHESMG